MTLSFNLPVDAEKLETTIAGNKFKKITIKLDNQLSTAPKNQLTTKLQAELYHQIRKEFCLMRNNLFYG